MLIKEPAPTYPPVIKIVYRPNERVKFSDIWIKNEIWNDKDSSKPRNSRCQKPAPRNKARLQTRATLG